MNSEEIPMHTLLLESLEDHGILEMEKGKFVVIVDDGDGFKIVTNQTTMQEFLGLVEHAKITVTTIG